MDKEKKERIILFIHKWLLHIEAIFIIGLMLTGFWILYKDNLIKQEISLNCGYAQEDYECFCRKDDITRMRAEIREEFDAQYFDQFGNFTLDVIDEDV